MGNKLLLADDSITIQKVVGIIFANEDYELTVVDNGAAALEKARIIKPDVILVDALMPEKTGYEVCAEVRQDPVLKNTPLLILTGAFEPFDEEQAKKCGADDFISKPFESQQLILRVKNLIELGMTRNQSGGAEVAPVAAAPAVTSPEPVREDVAPAAMPIESFADLSMAAPAATIDSAFTFAEEPVAAPVSAEPVFALPDEPAPANDVFSLTEVAVEGTIDDDLWGAFEVEELSAGEPVAMGEAGTAAEFQVLEAGDEFKAEETFSFGEEVSDDVFAVEPEVVEEIPVALAQEEEAFSFGEEPVGNEFDVFAQEQVPAPVIETVSAAAPPVDAFADMASFGDITFDEPPPKPVASRFVPEEPLVSASPEPVPAPGFTPEVAAPVAAVTAAALAAVVPEPVATVSAPVPPAPVAPAAVAPSAELTEAQLAAAVAKVSREIIEKIVWEVVPDLAEAMIKEEIRKIRAGIKD
jgi:CheY-like chemotaxis protein